MGEIGVLNEDERLELLHGRIFRMSPIGSLHAKVVNRLNKLLAQRLYRASGHDVMLSVQNPVALSETTEPESDLAVLASEGPPDGHPTPDDILLIVEVADTSLQYDRDRKVPLYAAAGIPEYWLVNLDEAYVDVYREPDGDTYARRTRHRRGDTLDLTAFPDLEPIPVHDLFPDERD